LNLKLTNKKEDLFICFHFDSISKSQLQTRLSFKEIISKVKINQQQDVTTDDVTSQFQQTYLTSDTFGHAPLTSLPTCKQPY